MAQKAKRQGHLTSLLANTVRIKVRAHIHNQIDHQVSCEVSGVTVTRIYRPTGDTIWGQIQGQVQVRERVGAAVWESALRLISTPRNTVIQDQVWGYFSTGSIDDKQ